MLPGETVGGEGSQCFECGKALELQVCRSAAGYYLGYWCDTDGPCGRETGYSSEEDAIRALEVYLGSGLMVGQRT